MRFHVGGIPESPGFSPDGMWTPLREPTPLVFQFLATPLGFLASGIVAVAWLFLTPIRLAQLDSVGTAVIALFAIIPIHELIHAAVHPRFGMSANSILGFWPAQILFYAHYFGELSRGRLVAILLMPTLIITFVPLIVCAFTQRSSVFLAMASTLNALLACGDVLGTGILLFQVPATATVRNQGWRTFWKIHDVGKETPDAT